MEVVGRGRAGQLGYRVEGRPPLRVPARVTCKDGKTWDDGLLLSQNFPCGLLTWVRDLVM